MNKILLITTGGTLACKQTENGLAPELKGEDILRYSNYADADIDIYDFRLIDSSVMTDEDRAELAELIWDKKDEYDSFVITHGTDSMAYTAAYLECALKNFDKSVILTGAQLPLVFEDTDAHSNLNLAIGAAMSGYWGVCVAFCCKLIPAKYVTKTDTESFDGFIATNGEYLINEIAKPVGEYELCRPKNHIGVIYITPNLDETTVETYMLHDGVVALALGSGGMPKHLEKAFDFLKKKGVKVYLRSQCPKGKVEPIYEAHSGVSKYIPIKDESVEWSVYAAMFGVI